MRCPLCEIVGSRDTVHAHLVAEHPDGVELWSVSDSRRRYRVACPLCGDAHEARVKPRSKDPAFLETFAHEIRMVAFDQLLNHVAGEHPELMTKTKGGTMTEVSGCNIPDELHYFVEKHVWARRGDDAVTVGLTDVAQHLAKGIISVTTKKAGKSIVKGKSLGTVESSKWVGPVPAPVGGEIVEVNEALKGDPGLLNRDPYGDGWIAKLKPADWDADSIDLVTGDAGVAAYRAFLDEQGISCADE